MNFAAQAVPVYTLPPAARNLPPLDLSDIKLAVEKVTRHWKEAAHRAHHGDLDQIASDLRGRIAIENWHDFHVSDFLRAADALFASHRLTDQKLQDLRDFIIVETSKTHQTAIISGMAGVFFDHYALDNNDFWRLGCALHNQQHLLDDSFQVVLKSVPEIFRPQRGIAALVTTMLMAVNPYEALTNLGIRFPHHGNFMATVHHAFLEAISLELTTSKAINRLLNWINPFKNLTLTKNSDLSISRLLEPWRREVPPPAIQHMLKDRLSQIFGDPRSTSGHWATVEPELRQLVCRWFATETVAAFIRVGDQLSHREADVWQVSREFWSNLNDRHLIKDAFVALSIDAEHMVRQRPEAVADRHTKLGRQLPSAGYRDVSLLIMHIGDKIVVEGTHGYQTYIFDADGKHCPRFPWDPLSSADEKRGIYDANKIRLTASYALRHKPSEDWKRAILAVVR